MVIIGDVSAMSHKIMFVFCIIIQLQSETTIECESLSITALMMYCRVEIVYTSGCVLLSPRAVWCLYVWSSVHLYELSVLW